MVTDLSSTKRYYTDYLSGFQYDNMNSRNGVYQLRFFPHKEGYVNNQLYGYESSPTFNLEYVYNHTDHLGNVRLSYRKNGTSTQILEENNYYPFGLKHKGYNDTSFGGSYKYKYQGQERQDELGLNWDSFKWRNYDFTTGRFMSIDPLSEKYVYNGVYNFSENRVVDGRELEGLEVVLLKDSKKNEPIIRTANNGQYADNPNTKTIHVFAHGNPTAVYNDYGKKGETTINSGSGLNKTLNENSELWKNSESKEGFTIVLHSCRTGKFTIDKNGDIITSINTPIAQNISSSDEMKGVTIIAPDERVGFSTNGTEVGPQVTKNANHNGDVKKGEKPIQTRQFGNWNSFQNGQLINQQPGNTKPEGKDQRSFWDKIFN